MRRWTRLVHVGRVPLGGGSPIAVQSMTKVDPHDPTALSAQIAELAEAGCEIVRLAVPDSEALDRLVEVRRGSPVPLVADIHFDHRLALAAIRAGVDKVRINPGNIGGEERLREVGRAAAAARTPVRVGVNSGSLAASDLARFGGPTAEALAQAALRSARVLEEEGLDQIVISVKASDVVTTVRAYEMVANASDYPLHLGVTEAGLPGPGTVKSAVGIGSLLLAGIGDTVRVSLTGHPRIEVEAAYQILSSLGLRRRGVDLVSCPTCGRCRVDLASIAREVQRGLADVSAPLRVAVMGCVVNGPGEAKDADVGVACGERGGVLFARGRTVGRVSRANLAAALIEEARRIAADGPDQPGGSGLESGRDRGERGRMV